MDVLLINPNSRKKDFVKESPIITPPINLMYVAQNLENNGYKTKIIDSFAENLSQEALLKRIKKEKAKYIGLPLYSSDLDYMHHLTKKIKSYNENIKIFFAGHHVSTLYKDVMKQYPNVDYIVRGEGEHTTLNLLNSLEKNISLNKVRGISYRDKKKIKHNIDNKPIQNLDKIPIPSRKLINPKLYYSKLSKRNRVDVLITSRGCPYKCTFCAKLNNFFRSYRTRSIPNIIDELSIINETETIGVEIYDEIFTLKKRRVLDIMRSIKKEKFDFEFRIRTRVTHIDNEILSSLKKNGCSTISYGVESGSQHVLNNIKKETSPTIIRKAFQKTEKHGINILGFFMIGNKGDTPVSIRQFNQADNKLCKRVKSFICYFWSSASLSWDS